MSAIVTQGTNILLVDDNSNNLIVLEAILKDLRQNLIFAHSGKEALKQALNREFAVILMDAHMPGIDGFEVARLLRVREKTRYTPIIFVSALYKEEINVQLGYSLGAVDYIFKPIVPDILRSKIKVFVDLHTNSTYAKAMQKELEKRRQVELGYKQLAQQTQIIFASMREGICGLNTKGQINFTNPAAGAILGRELPTLIGQPFELVLGKDDKNNPRQLTEHAIYQVLKGKISYHSAEDVFCQRDGERIAVEYTVSSIQDKRLKYQGILVIFKDISERKKAEENARKHQQHLELAQAARLNVMKEMASTLAHEVNQPIANIANYIKGCIHRIEQGSAVNEEILSMMKRAVQQSEHAGAIVHRVKDLACTGKLYYEEININAVIEEIIKLMDSEFQAANAIIKIKLAKNLPLVVADKIQIQQVVMNLLRNGLDAINNENIKLRQLQVHTRLVEQKLIEVNVLDSGSGFSPEHAGKLFNAYFTTKPKGMGMGLAISRTILEAHGGGLTARSNPKGGAWFQFVLPLNIS